MTQVLSVLNPEVWSKRMGFIQQKALVAREICSFEERAQLKDGDTVHRPYMTNLSVNTYTKGSDVTIQDINPTDETLTVATTKEVSFYVDNVDELQNRYDIAMKMADNAAYLLNDAIDTEVFGQYTAAANTLVSADIGEAAGDITLTASNVHKVFTGLKRKLREANVAVTGDVFATISPQAAEYIEQYVAANGFNTADSTLKNGYAGDFLGVKVYVSNNLTVETNTIHLLAGKKGAIDLVVQKEPNVLITQPEKKIGKNYITWTLYGLKTFFEGSKELVDVQCTSASA